MVINITLHLQNKLPLTLCIFCEKPEVETHVKEDGRHHTQFIFIRRVFFFASLLSLSKHTASPRDNTFLAMCPFLFAHVPLFLQM